ncbi:DUF6355 family natural product biosynthesis protein [Yinghuangia soli]|uniref:DUF6355 family natural product biosynthesis protein n=1 Tax=Yinghuangia soli TaxID=2908204 RepID=A0AA41Q7V9_9ACTN|nr:DUF6355 family natural product biosynthesis protein [Yinghuangia soli]MCF2533108.1 DUF6355 family natural product biosynthesis protein [Yinghuangia soli]
MHLRRLMACALASSAFLLAGTGVSAASAASAPVLRNPCGFFETSSDAFYNHCTDDGSNIVIHVEVAWAPDYERCVGPGQQWLGSASKIQGAYYTGRTC